VCKNVKKSYAKFAGRTMSEICSGKTYCLHNEQYKPQETRSGTQKCDTYYSTKGEKIDNKEKETRLVWPCVTNGCDWISTQSNALYRGWTTEKRETTE